MQLKHKNIKKSVKILSIAILGLLILPVLLSLVILIPSVQNYVGNSITKTLSNDWGTEVSFSTIYFKPIKNIEINDLLLKDVNNDTLLYVKRFEAPINSFSIKGKRINFGNVSVSSLQSHIVKQKNKSNFEFLLDSLGKNSSGDFDWKFTLQTIKIRKSKLRYINYDADSISLKFNPNNFTIDNFNATISNIKTVNDSLSLRIDKFSFIEHQGIAINELKCSVGYGKNGLGFEDLSLKSRNTFLAIDYFRLKYDTIVDLNDYWDGPQFALKIKSLKSTSKDIQQFIPKSPVFKNAINLSGKFRGTLNDFKGSAVSLSFGTGTSVKTNFQVRDLSNIEDAYVYLNIKDLRTTPNDIIKLINLNRENQNLTIANSINKIGDVKFKGKISGFSNDIVAFGNFQTELGDLSTDIGVKTTADGKIIYAGLLDTKQFKIGELFNSEENLNRVSLALSVNGYRTNDMQYRALVDGKIDSIDIRGYNYEHVQLKGYLSNKKFNGNVILKDPNIDLEFDGQVDFTKDLPEFDFVADVNNIKPNQLHFFPKLNDSEIGFKVNAKLFGQSLNTINGNVLIHDGHLSALDKQYQLDSLNVSFNDLDSTHNITITSDIINGYFNGRYEVATLSNQVYYYLHKTLPSIFTKSEPYEISGNSIDFKLVATDINPLLSIISPSVKIAKGSFLQGNLNSDKQTIQINANSKSITYGNVEANKLKMALNLNGGNIKNSISVNAFNIGSLVSFNNFNTTQEAFSDSLLLNINWDDKKEIENYKGDLNIVTKFNKPNERLFTQLNIEPSSYVISDSLWTIQQSRINIVPNGMHINALRIFNARQELNMNGSLSDKNADLEVNIQNFDLENAMSLRALNKVHIAGLLNANLKFEESYLNPVISSDVRIDSLDVNHELIGDFFAESVYDRQEEEVKISTEIKKGNRELLGGGGFFNPKSKDYNFDFKLDSLPVGFLEIYLNKVMQNIRGTSSGNVGLRKTDTGIGLEGKVALNHVNFSVDLIKCSFFVDDSITLKPEQIIFDNELTDIHNKKGALKGIIAHKSFKDMHYDLSVNANNMLLLNTRELDNEMYYGTVYGSGALSVTGTTYNMEIDIKARNEKNSRLYIPLNNRSASLNNNFIQFYNPNIDSSEVAIEEEEYVAERNNYELNMEMEITPEAQVQVIFDPNVGDLLKSNGKADLQIQMNRDKEIFFFGQYTASSGEYFFSLENVINKKFDINNGGTITWQGDPYEAIIDLTATYKIKTSIAPLIQTGVYGSEELTGEASRRVPIHCDLILEDQLTRPAVSFEINAPTLTQTNQNLIQDAISTEEELNRQILSLLVLNKFYTPEYNANSGGQNQGVGNAVSANASEVLSSQLSSLLSQISKDVDIGVAYRPEDNISREEIEVALSTQILNDRVTINGNVEYGKYSENSAPVQQNASNIVGDFDMDIKLNKKGSLRAKVYTRSNDDFSYDSSPTTQGVGLSYQEDFNTFGELFQKYWKIITGKGKNEDEIKLEDE